MSRLVPEVTYRALLIILIALLMAIALYVAFAVGITAASRTGPESVATLRSLESASPLQAHSGAPMAAGGSVDTLPVMAEPGRRPTPRRAVSPVRPPAAATTQPSATVGSVLKGTSSVKLRRLATDAASVRETLTGWAAWCAPTPTRCQGWGGDALLAGVPSFRWGDDPYTVQVSANGRSVLVTVVSYCACGDRKGIPTVIDLSPRGFEALAPLSVGVLSVTVRVP